MNIERSLRVPGLCGMGLHFQMDGFRLVYLVVAVIMWSISGIFSREYMEHYQNRGRYYWFFWVTFLATAGVFLSADFYTTFIFFEIMSFTSYVWVAFDERAESLKAAETYLAVAVIGGMVMLMGLFLLENLCGTLVFERVGELAERVLAEGSKAHRRQLYVAGGLLLFGFGAKAGCFPLHIWLPKAHPVAPAPASALLSGILTKAGIFGIIIVSCHMFCTDRMWGFLLVCLGLITMFLGALLALFSVNLKRTLACSSVSQIGFILIGIGMSCLLRAAGESGRLAVRGAFLHMVNHSLFKLVLFLCAAAVFMNLHQLELNDIRGFGRKKPLLLFCFLMGALGIGGMPFWSGYVSKTLLHESIVEYGRVARQPVFWQMAEWLFLVSGGMTVAYMLKLFVALFVDRHPVRQAEFEAMSANYMRKENKIALVLAAALFPLLGMTASTSMDLLADLGQGFFGPVETGHLVHYFSFGNLKGGLLSIGIGIGLYLFVVRRWMMGVDGKIDDMGGDLGMCYRELWPSWFDLENLWYRPLLQVVLPGISGAICGFVDRYLVSTVVSVFLAVSSVLCRDMDQMADGVIRLARESTHSQLPRVTDGTREKAGKKSVLSAGKRWMGVEKRQLTEKIFQLEERIRRNGRLVEESFSFGLMLFAIGLCLTLGYLLLGFLRHS